MTKNRSTVRKLDAVPSFFRPMTAPIDQLAFGRMRQLLIGEEMHRQFQAAVPVDDLWPQHRAPALHAALGAESCT